MKGDRNIVRRLSQGRCNWTYSKFSLSPATNHLASYNRGKKYYQSTEPGTP